MRPENVRNIKVENINFESSKAKIKSYYSFNGIEYFGTSKGLWSRSNNGKLKLIKNIDVLSLEHNRSNTLYVGTKKGMYYLKNGELSRYSPSTLEPKDFNKIAVNDIEFIDKYEIW